MMKKHFSLIFITLKIENESRKWYISIPQNRDMDREIEDFSTRFRCYGVLLRIEWGHPRSKNQLWVPRVFEGQPRTNWPKLSQLNRFVEEISKYGVDRSSICRISSVGMLTIVMIRRSTTEKLNFCCWQLQKSTLLLECLASPNMRSFQSHTYYTVKNEIRS